MLGVQLSGHLKYSLHKIYMHLLFFERPVMIHSFTAKMK